MRRPLSPILEIMSTTDCSATPPSAQANINAIVALEEHALQQRRFADRMSDVIASFVGSVTFVVLHLIWFGIWVGLNVGLWKFDPYPFALLCMLVSLEGVLLSTFVLIKQNRMSQRADQRSHLDLQINLLAEKEVTKLIQMQRLICQRLGIKEVESDQELAELSDITAVENLARELNEKIPTD